MTSSYFSFSIMTACGVLGVPGVRMASMRTTCEHARQPRVCECRQENQEPEFETVGACLIMLHGISDTGANFEGWYVEFLGHQEQHLEFIDAAADPHTPVRTLT